MTQHARQQIREAVKAQLTGIEAVADRVYTGRVYPIDTFPGLAVLTGLDRVDDSSTIASRQFRVLDLIVQIQVKESGNIQQQMDALSVAIESRLTDSNSLDLPVQSLNLRQTNTHLSGEQEKPVGLAVMEFEIVYCTAPGQPQTIIK